MNSGFDLQNIFQIPFADKSIIHETSPFIATEIISQTENEIGKTSDILSLGIYLYDLIERKFLFRAIN
jgi:serine/threonine protein kinase